MSVFDKRNKINLSTPHGTLGTEEYLAFLTEEEALSTPHGTLGTRTPLVPFCVFQVLSTPHGTLGTPNDHIN